MASSRRSGMADGRGRSFILRSAALLGTATRPLAPIRATPAERSFALGHPEKLIDFAYRAVHEMTVKAKAIVTAYYGSRSEPSYWNGCSSGGKQGRSSEARAFPPTSTASSPARRPITGRTSCSAACGSRGRLIRRRPASFRRGKYALIHNAVLEACDAFDGAKDGVLEDTDALPVRSGAAAVQGRRHRSTA